MISWSRLTIPSPIVTGSISTKTCRTRGSCQSIVKPRRKSICWSAAAGHRELHDGGGEDRDRVGVDPEVGVEAVAQHDDAATMITAFQTSGENAAIEKRS